MKKIIKFISLFVGILAVACAQAELPMLTSRQALLEYSLREAREIDGLLSTIENAGAGYDHRSWTAQKSALDLLEEVKKIKFSTEGFAPGPVLYSVTVSDRDGATLFFGQKESRLVQVDGVWVLPDGATNIELIQTNIHIRVAKTLRSAEIVSLNRYGSSVSRLGCRDQRFSFSPESAGLENAYLRLVFFTDASEACYEIKTGKLVDSIPHSLPRAGVDIPDALVLRNVYSYKNVTSVKLVVTSTRGRGINPIIMLDISSGRIVQFDVQTQKGRRPIAYEVNPEDTDGYVEHTAQVRIPAGVTYVKPVWDSEDFSEDPVAVATASSG